MDALNWQNIWIWAAVIAFAVMMIGFAFKMISKLVKLWLVVLVILISLKLLFDHGYLPV